MKGIHRVTKKLAGGERRKYHYVFRGGPKFWDSSMTFAEGEQEYTLAYTDAVRATAPKPENSSLKSTTSIVENFKNSIHYKDKSERTRKRPLQLRTAVQ